MRTTLKAWAIESFTGREVGVIIAPSRVRAGMVAANYIGRFSSHIPKIVSADWFSDGVSTFYADSLACLHVVSGSELLELQDDHLFAKELLDLISRPDDLIQAVDELESVIDGGSNLRKEAP